MKAGLLEFLLVINREDFDVADFGIKISPTGVDVLTAADKNLLFTTKHNVLKISEVKLETIADLSSSTVTHGLGYVPAFLSFVKDGSNNWHPIANGLIPVSISTAASSTIVNTLNRDGADRTVRTIVFIDKIAN